MKTKKRFGQHFLIDTGVINHIINCLNLEALQPVVEIGPGLGALTKPLLKLVKQMDAIELDFELIPELTQRCQPHGKLNIHQGDALQFDFTTIAKESGKIHLVGNLPYNISTPLLFHLFSQLNVIRTMDFMLQLEVADRLIAKPGTKNYSRLTVMAQYYCDIKKCFTIQPQAFHPEPKVYSAFVKLTPKPDNSYPPTNQDHLTTIVKLAFQKRRKTIANNLKTLIDKATLAKLAIDPETRPERLDIASYIKITNYLYSHY